MKKHRQPTDLIKTTEAQIILAVSSTKMAKLLKEGVLRHWTNPLDDRMKFVSRAEVDALKDRFVEAA